MNLFGFCQSVLVIADKLGLFGSFLLNFLDFLIQ